MADDVPQLKLLTIGDSGVGKSWLLLRWVGEGNRLVKGSLTVATIGIDFKMKSIMVDGKRVKVQVWDTAGQERYRNITKSYYRNSHGILLVYDVTDRKSFVSIRSWIQQIQMHADVNVNKILIGNKCDMISDRVVSFEEGEALSREFKMQFLETSAFHDINVEEAFQRISKDVMLRLETTPITNTPGNNRALQTAPKAISSADLEVKAPAKKGWCLIL